MKTHRTGAATVVVCFVAAALVLGAERPRRQQVRIVRASESAVAAAADLIATGVQGTIKVQLPLEQGLETMSCSDLTVRVGRWQTPPPVPHGDPTTIPVFVEVRSAMATGSIGSGTCRYKVAGVASGPARVVFLDVDYPKVSPARCASVWLNTQPANPTVTFTAGQMTTQNFAINPDCILPPA